ncbi:sulfatase-like hydrolase/transferase [Novipirellula sp. SH528]|uniref:sulfatase-like hydrolase/transferase n=1 Tax=Novipirellula sp. SH528 TaxID=3454466 RepID=UPI003FA0761A
MKHLASKLALVTAAILCIAPHINAEEPNIVFILVDDQSWNGTTVPMIPGKDFSKSSQLRTPNIEQLASQGMTFSQAYAAHCTCECSRAAIQMGRTTTTLNAPDKGSRNWSAPVSQSLANTLKRVNPDYRAAHLGKWQWSHTPKSMGYDESDGITMNEDGDSTNPSDPKLSFSITRRANAFMEQQVVDGHPFYLQLSYYAVHPQPQALATTIEKYRGRTARPTTPGRADPSVRSAMTEDLDTCVGAILKKIDELKIAENTIVIYMSDNGGRTDVMKGGKGNLGDGGLRVPLIIRGPGIKSGSYSGVPLISYDLTATIVDFAAPGSSLFKGNEGGSWKPILLNGGVGEVQRRIDRFVFHQAVEVEHPQSAIRKGDFKLLYYWDTKEAFLYNIEDDLREDRNLAIEMPELATAMQKELKDHVRAGLGEQAYAALERGESPRRPGGNPGGRNPGPPRRQQRNR